MEDELDYLFLTNELVCDECLEELRKNMLLVEDPSPWPP